MVTLQSSEIPFEYQIAKTMLVCGKDFAATDLAVRIIKKVILMDKTVYIESDTGTINREHHTNIVNDVSKADYKIYINKYTCQPDILYEIESVCDYEPERFIPLKYHLTEYQALGKNEYQQQLKETDFKILKELEKMFLQDHPLVIQRNELRNGFNKTVGKLKEEGAINDSNG